MRYIIISILLMVAMHVTAQTSVTLDATIVGIISVEDGQVIITDINDPSRSGILLNGKGLLRAGQIQRGEIVNAEEIVMKNGMRALKGQCGTCGTKVFRILGKA